MVGDPLQEFIEGTEYQYYETSTRLYGENSIKRGGWIIEDNSGCDPKYLYVSDVLVADLIIKNENRILPKYLPRIEKAVEAILSHSLELDLEPDEWPVMIEIAQRVKENMPRMLVVHSPLGELMEFHVRYLEKLYCEESEYDRSKKPGGQSAALFYGYSSANLVTRIVTDLIIADIISKNENKIFNKYVSRVKEAIQAVLSRSHEIVLEPGEFDQVVKIAERVKNALPKMRVVRTKSKD